MGNLEFGAAFSRVFDLYAKHAAPLLVWSAIFQSGLALVWSLFVVSIASGGFGALIAFPFLLALSVVAGALMSGAYITGLDIADATGRFPGFGEVWPNVSSKLGALVLTSIIAGVGIFFGFLLLIVPGLILLTWWALVAPIVMLEDKSGTEALGRSRELVRGNGWTVFGLVIVTGLITGFVGGILGTIVENILGGKDGFVGAFGGQFVSGTLTAPVSALLAIVMYQALRGDGTPGPDTMPYPPQPTESTPPPQGPGTPGGHSGPFV